MNQEQLRCIRKAVYDGNLSGQRDSAALRQLFTDLGIEWSALAQQQKVKVGIILSTVTVCMVIQY
jgi:hypothetical protein